MCLHPWLPVQVTGVVSEELTPLQATDLTGPKLADLFLIMGVCVCVCVHTHVHMYAMHNQGQQRNVFPSAFPVLHLNSSI